MSTPNHITKENIDFFPCKLKGILKIGQSLILQFSEQPLYKNNAVTKTYACELSLHKGNELDHRLNYPIEAQNIDVKHKQGGNSCFLPLDFEQAGPVTISLEINDVFIPIATGDDVKLKILGQISELIVEEP